VNREIRRSRQKPVFFAPKMAENRVSAPPSADTVISDRSLRDTEGDMYD